jgi:hypothetical protein
MASAGPAAGQGASTATAAAGSGWRSGSPAMASVGSGTRSTDTDWCRKANPGREPRGNMTVAEPVRSASVP